jgi:phosphonopyruvate decarboxylase
LYSIIYIAHLQWLAMINCKEFYEALVERGVDFFAGVPDSLLKNFNAYVMDNASADRHIITSNEGNAVALAAGHHLATGKMGMVYMQNSGQGNAVNPLTSLADGRVYSIPMLLLIGWRGEPGKRKDEPQHVKQGNITTGLLNILGIEYDVVPNDIDETKKLLDRAVGTARERGVPFGLVVSADTFEKYKLLKEVETNFELNRESALKLVAGELGDTSVVISTTGKTSRELIEYREALGHGQDKDFPCVGNMGHASSIALGVALRKPEREVYVFDGDGAFIMHQGILGVIASKKPKNFKHIVFNNGAHDSVGGQPTVGFEIDMPGIALASGYKNAWRAETSVEIKARMGELKASEGPSLLEIRVNKGAREDLGRPKKTPVQTKEAFMKNLKS